jgi:hypothetical protein
MRQPVSRAGSRDSEHLSHGQRRLVVSVGCPHAVVPLTGGGDRGSPRRSLVGVADRRAAPGFGRGAGGQKARAHIAKVMCRYQTMCFRTW